ncbi:hypothetical protein [Aulosira sp. FACHB-615]|uniref:hypothetical protein n=1 Tax=Aulosira sp. FACHB-615 TaxID=2692777 RepID=UPI001684B1FB|nr:hypothetical protein [Aulosira sp. FACHB-615]MBD2491135.1 hypothetical protein [Aulosira sp. FACHB-615]
MPSYTRGKKRPNLVFVVINNSMFFGFKPKDLTSLPGITTADVTALGHVQPNAVAAGKLKIIGAKAPNPPRVLKKTGAPTGQQQSVSTFCGYNNIGLAQAAGWTLSKSRTGVSLRAPNSPRQSLTAIAELSDGTLYCFPMNKADFESYGAALGLKNSTNITTDTERSKLVSGASIPYPGRAAILLPSGSTFSSFFSTGSQGSASEAGYDILSEEKILASAPANNN